VLQPADKMKGDNRIYNLGGVAVKQRDILDGLDPSVHFPLVNGLPKLVTDAELHLPRLKSNGVGEDRRIGVAFKRLYDVYFVLPLIFNGKLLILKFLVEKLLWSNYSLSSVINEDVQLLHMSLHVVDESLHLYLG